MNKQAKFVGVDGCKAGWIAVADFGDPLPRIEIATGFGELLERHPAAIFAVDMPIGLPERINRGGRGPEQAVRAVLGARQSSVFSIPSRSAVNAEDYRVACAAALVTSTPPRKVSRQAFNLFAKIRQLDAIMTRELELRIYEVHPELAFWRLGGAAMREPKKVRNKVHEPGMAERRELLARNGFDRTFLCQLPPRGAGADDFLDACACLAIARRIGAGQARPFPDPPAVTEGGARMAIWA